MTAPPADGDEVADAGHPANAGQPEQGKEEPRQPVYPGVTEWVTYQFLPMFRRPLGGEFRWCARWWEHAEAITRLTALWHSWEKLRLEPATGMATWLRDHLDHQLPILLGRTGPFAQCTEDEHLPPRQATAEDAPRGWWTTGAPAEVAPISQPAR